MLGFSSAGPQCGVDVVVSSVLPKDLQDAAGHDLEAVFVSVLLEWLMSVSVHLESHALIVADKSPRVIANPPQCLSGGHRGGKDVGRPWSNAGAGLDPV